MKREDVEALALELRDLKEILRDVSGKLGRMEKRLRVFFPASFPKQHRREPLVERETAPTISPAQALQIYNELVDLARNGREREAGR